ncbi:hypothetical protein EWM64_g6662 [Hericium alpestre]|uniref:Protein kinase domain-containing protein n=1 Tax=Hericium alpestre TaxID=135208 RepID=A0A4Y9ZV04_9AGAM|nr:hypothetical protein EWM64_g6662 [Hericium alpestre]
MPDSSENLFNYSSGCWIINDNLRLAERRREFEVDELCRLAAQSVGRRPQDIDTFVKLAEGSFNRIFLITMHDGFQMVVRIPYPITVPKFYAIASEVATMRFLRASGLPVPEVYNYSPSSDNATKMEYIFMEFMRGTKLSDVWMELEEPDIASVLRQIAQLESRMMSIPFSAGGSLYYADNLEKHERREAYGYGEQSLSDHTKNLERYLLIAPLLIPKKSSLYNFHIRHPDLQPSNVIVSTSSGSNHLKIVSLLDWQHAPVLSQFLLTGIPGHLQNYDDPVSQDLIPPSLPANMDKLDQSEQIDAIGLYHRCLVHFHYVKNTEEYNKLHHDALSDPVSTFICCLFDQAGAPWEGETHVLQATLIEATETWERLTGGGVPCPVEFEPEDLHKTKKLSKKLQLADENFEACRGMVGFETETWVSNEHYEMAMALAELLKLKVLTRVPEGEVQAKTEANWFLDDMDEENYM